MEKSLVRGSSINENLVVLLLIGLLITALGTGLGLAYEFASAPVLALITLGVGLLLAAVVMLFLSRRLRQWAQVQDKGFFLTSRAAERFIADDQITAMAITRETYAPQGRYEGILRRCYLWLRDDGRISERLLLETRLKYNQVDPLQGLMVRLETRLLSEAKGKLLGGKPIEEPDWRIERGQLSIRHGQEWRTCPLSDISAVDFYSDSLCVWTLASEEIWGSLLEKSANSYILYMILREEVTKHPQTTLAVAKGAMGRVLFERPAGQPGMAFLGCWLFFVMGVVFLIIGFEQPVIWIFAVAFLAIAGAFLWLALRLRKARFRCFEAGICHAGMYATRSLRFDQLATYAYSVRLLYTYGAYAGSIYKLSFEPFPYLGLPGIKFVIYDKKPDGNFDRLHDEVTGILAKMLAKELMSHGSVQWTPRLRLTAMGIEYTRGGLFRRRQVIRLPYADIQKQDFKAGRYRIWIRGNPKPLIRERCDRANFYPGLRVFKETMTRAVQAQPPHS